MNSNAIVTWIKAWPRKHPILGIIWLAFVALCIFAVVVEVDGQRADPVYGLIVLPLLSLIVVLYTSRTVNRFQKIRELTAQRDALRRGETPPQDRDIR